MASPEDSSPNPMLSPPSTSPGGCRYPEATGTTSTSPPPAPGSSVISDAHQRNDQHQYHSKERHDRSRSHSPQQHYTSRYTERGGRRDINTSMAHKRDMDYPPRPSRRHDYRDDDYGYSNRDSDRYRPSPLPDSTTATGPRHQDQYQSRSGDSRYDTRGRLEDYDYTRSTYPQQQQTHTRGHYSDYRQHYDDRRYQRYHDGSYEPGSYNSRSRPPRRTVDRGTEEERQRSTIIFVGNLPYDYREQDVATMFDRYGKLVKITIPIDSLTMKNKGFAFVEFEQRLNAQEAMDNFQGFSVGGRRLKLDWDIGLNKKDTRRAPAPNDRGRTRSPPRSSSPPPTTRRRADTYLPSTDENSYRRTAVADTYRP